MYGALCNDRIEWLVKILEDSKKPTMIFLHHFPIEVDNPLFKNINLIESKELSILISKYNNILGLYCGHYHYSRVGIFAEKVCWISPSVAPAHVFKK